MDVVQTVVLAPSALSGSQWNDIWDLTREFYDVERRYAEAELRRRQRLAMFVMNGALLGMASIDIYSAKFRGRRLMVKTLRMCCCAKTGGAQSHPKLGFRTFLTSGCGIRCGYLWFFDTFSYRAICYCRGISGATGRVSMSPCPRTGRRSSTTGRRDVRTRLGPVRGVSVRSARTPACDRGAAHPHRGLGSQPAILRARQPRARRRRHAGLPVSFDAREPVHPHPACPATPRTSRTALTADPARATLRRWTCAPTTSK